MEDIIYKYYVNYLYVKIYDFSLPGGQGGSEVLSGGFRQLSLGKHCSEPIHMRACRALESITLNT